MRWTVSVARSAAKNLVKIPSKDRERIRTALLEMELNPFSGDITHLRDMAPAFRRRNEKTYRKNR